MRFGDFYRRVLPCGDWRFFLWRKAGAITRILDGSDALLSATSSVIEGTDPDWYFATAGYAEGAPARKNANVRATKALRLDLDAGPEKYDPDNPSKAYETQREAVADLVRFSKATCLVPTYIVSSGYGLHVYYAFTEEITDLGAWDAAAADLGELCQQHALRADPSVTTDRGRLLRVIGSLHSSTGTRVAILKDTGKLHQFSSLADLIGEQVSNRALVLPTVTQSSKVTSLADKLADEAGLGPPKYFSSFKKAALKCDALLDALTNDRRLEYPQWLAVIRTADHCVEGRELAHEISLKDAQKFGGEYEPAEVENKLDSFTSDIVLCSTFVESRPACRACPHYGSIKGPKELGKLTAKDPQAQALPEPSIEPLPQEDADKVNAILPDDFPAAEEVGKLYGFTPVSHHTGNNLMLYRMVRTETDDGIVQRKAPVAITPFYLSQRTGSYANNAAAYTLRVYDPDYKRWHDHPFPAELSQQRDKLLEYLAKLGVVRCEAGPQNGQFLQQYIMNLLQAILRKPPTPAAKSGFGFQYDAGGRPIYVQGQLAVDNTGKLTPAIIPSHLGELYVSPTRVAALRDNRSGKYDDQDWHKLHAATVRHVAALRSAYAGAPHYQMVLAMGMGAILMPFAQDRAFTGDGEPPVGGAVVTLFSEKSGVGKSTLHDLAVSWYYDAQTLKISGGGAEGGSEVARFSRAADLGNLPNVQDELSNAEPAFVSRLLYQLGNGMDKTRAQVTGLLRPNRTFSAITFASTNISQRALMTEFRPMGQGEQMRVLEVNFDVIPDNARPVSMSTIGHAQWGAFYAEHIAPGVGAAGLILAREVMKHGFDEVFRMVTETKSRLDRECKLAQPERYFSRLGACMVVANELMHRAGIEAFDTKVIIAAFHDSVERSRVFMRNNALTPDQLMCEMITDLRSEMLFTEGERHANSGGEIPLYMPRDRVQARFIQDRNQCLISSTRAAEWCKKRNVQLSRILELGVGQGWILPSGYDELGLPIPFHNKVNITRGVIDTPMLRTRAIIVDVAKLFGEDGATATEDGKVVYLPVPRRDDQSESPRSSAS